MPRFCYFHSKKCLDDLGNISHICYDFFAYLILINYKLRSETFTFV